ncbi:hypothetical protein NEF87_000858 [Candidatus Lokiarchaeum ossiferum]|uniref:Histidine phosphatase family protein n=1 Tax=Candidatus Lokiarchaeum ossiferum TaxID=2951803 RepID=A0ABY6HM31_9ARCH|nr:hypothetical protein NEF87_000858 [Candidatus Lokiarchaeum sp. B-35]
MSNLADIHWNRDVLNIISQSEDLIPDLPAILMIRHSAREEPKDLLNAINAPLTELGKKLAIEFGDKLNISKQYRIFHSPKPRCKNTALKIQEGLDDNQVKTEFKGELDSLIRINSDRNIFAKYWNRDGEHRFVDYWFSGFYPKWEIEPAIVVAQRTAKDIMHNFQEIESNKVDLYISHDYSILVYLRYWCGILATKEWINYLGGFWLQFQKNHIFLLFGGNKYHIPYPAWWIWRPTQ